MFLLILILLFSIPSIVFIYGGSSLAVGLFIAGLINIFYSFNSVFKVKFSIKFFLIPLIFFVIILIQSVYYYFDQNILKNFNSVLLLFFLFISSFFLGCKIYSLNEEVVRLSLLRALFFFLFCGWASILLPYNLVIQGFSKTIFPFSEPSHYALCVGFFSVICAKYLNNKLKIIVFISMLFQSLLIPNLTLLIFSLIAFFIYWLYRHSYYLILLFFCAITLIYLTYDVFLSYFPYFSERLKFSNDTDNLSTLVYMQGFDDAYKSLISSNGFGLGFQMAGTGEIGNYGKVIRDLTGSDLNRLDGGFLSSKIISEFGIFGLSLIIIYLYKVLKFIYNPNKFDLLFNLSLIGIFAELFLRGYGYFSPSIFLFFSFLCYSHLNKVNS